MYCPDIRANETIANKWPINKVSVSIALACESVELQTKASPTMGSGQLTIAMCKNHVPVIRFDAIIFVEKYKHRIQWQYLL